jgi:O-antigen/teichoic acid export membrane protein
MLALISLGVTRLVHGALIGRATDKTTYGLVGTLIAVATISSLALPAGVASAMSKFIPHARGRGSTASAHAVYRYLTRVGLAGSALLGLGAGLVTPLFLPIHWPEAVALGLLTFSFSVYSFDKAALYGFDRVAPYTRLELSTGLLAIAATVIVVAVGWTTYLLPLVLGYSAFVLGARWLLRSELRTTPGTEFQIPAGVFDRREVIGFVALACAGTLASTGFLQGTQLLAQIFASRTEVAYFTVSVTLIGPMYFLPRALNLALFPAMAHAQGSGDLGAVRRHADVSTRALLVLLAPVFGVGLLVAREVLVTVYGKDYAEAAGVFQLMLAATYLSVVQVAAVNALSSGSQRQVRIPVGSAVSGAVIGLALSALLTRPFGVQGIGLAYLIGTVVIAGGPLLATWRIHQLRWAGVLARSLFLVALGGIGAVVLDAVEPTGAQRWWWLTAAVAGLGVIAAGLSYRDVRWLISAAKSR